MKIKQILIVLATVFLFSGCKENKSENNIKVNYLDYSKSDDQATGGIKMIPITTPIGKFNVWTKRVGNNPTIKVLLLHGGPGGTHEFFESFDGFFQTKASNIFIMISWVLTTATNQMITAYGQLNALSKK